MKHTEQEAHRLCEVLCFGSASDVSAELEKTGDEDLHDVCTTIMDNGHTIVHVLAQRQKVTSLMAVLKRGVDVHTRNAQGTTPIHLALQHNALSSAKILLDHGARVSEVINRRKGTSLLHMLVMCDRPLAVRLLLEEGAEVNCRDAQDRTPLHLAAIYSNFRIVNILMRNEGCNANALDGAGHTPLMLAILNNNLDLARRLAAAPKTDVSLKDRGGMSALHLAVAHGQVEVVRAILQRNTANINSKERSMGRTPIHFACALTAGSKDDAALAPDSTGRNHGHHGDHSNGSHDGGNGDCDDNTACNHLSSNTSNGLEDVADETEVTVDTDSTSGVSSILNAKHTEEDAKTMTHTGPAYQNGADVPKRAIRPASEKSLDRKLNGQPTETKSYQHNVDRTALKSREGARSTTPRNGFRRGEGVDDHSHKDSTPKCQGKISRSDNFGSKPRPLTTFTAPLRERTKASRESFAFRRPATASGRLSTRVSSLQRISFSPRLSVANTHYSLSGRTDSVFSHHRRESTVSFVLTPANVGAIRCKLVSLLLECGADANLMTQFRKSALHMAAMLGDANVMALLLPHITNPNMLSASNKTALHLAVQGGHTACVSQLIHAGANLGLRDMSGMPVLNMACKLGHADIVLKLLKAKADKNSADFRQMTPLHHACQNGHADVIDILLKAGCRSDLVDDQGKLPLDYRINRVAEKKEEEGKEEETEVLPGTVPQETSMEPTRQRKKGTVLLPTQLFNHAG